MTFWGLLRGAAGDRAAYRDAAAGRPGQLLGYLVLLITVATVGVTVKVHRAVSQGLEEAGPWLKANMPDIRIANGVVSSPVAQPYVWEQEEFVFILDTTGETTALDLRYPRGILLTQTSLLYRKSPRESREYSLREVKAFELDDAAIDRFIAAGRRWLWIFFAVAIWLANLVMRTLQALAWTLLGVAVNAVSRRGLRYAALFNLGVLALTVPIVFDLAMVLGGVQARGARLVSAGLYAGYLVWGILAQPEPSAAGPEAPPAST